jgi:hypothetical protein
MGPLWGEQEQAHHGAYDLIWCSLSSLTEQWFAFGQSNVFLLNSWKQVPQLGGQFHLFKHPRTADIRLTVPALDRFI